MVCGWLIRKVCEKCGQRRRRLEGCAFTVARFACFLCMYTYLGENNFDLTAPRAMARRTLTPRGGFLIRKRRAELLWPWRLQTASAPILPRSQRLAGVPDIPDPRRLSTRSNFGCRLAFLIDVVQVPRWEWSGAFLQGSQTKSDLRIQVPSDAFHGMSQSTRDSRCYIPAPPLRLSGIAIVLYGDQRRARLREVPVPWSGALGATHPCPPTAAW